MATSSIENKNLWSVRETAARLGISERSLHNQTAPRGTLHSVKIGVRVLYRPETVEAWLRGKEGDETTEDKTGHEEVKGEQEPEASSDC